MRRWRSVLGVLLVLVLALVPVACGGGNGEAEQTTAATETQTAAEEGPQFETIDEGVLTAGSDIPFPPFEFREGGELTGFDVEIVQE
ncbi:MAG: hypothetical protein KY396_04040, partial [Actinobacteria bacterium]|nr:hypothetical protein [Actinomycetota bacterium]